ncbi:MAG: cytochrome c maturation protein CcmE [Hasllibacter sp.]
MRSLKKQRRIQVIAIGAFLLVGATALAGYGLRDGISLYRTLAEVEAAPPRQGEVFRIGGVVAPGSLVTEGMAARFDVTDGTRTMPVAYEGILPDLFAEGECTLVRGRLQDGVFGADEVLAKHDESYNPREVEAAMAEAGVRSCE